MRRALAIVGEWDTTWRQTRAVVGSDSTQCRWRHTVSKHQARIQQYLVLRHFEMDENNALERFTFGESCRLEQTALLLARAQEFLKERRVVFPAESALLRLVGEQKKLAHARIRFRQLQVFICSLIPYNMPV